MFYPSLAILRKSIVLIMQENKYSHFVVFSGCIEWKIVRLIWIGFYNNENNDKCLIKTLPKDIIKLVVSFLGRVVDEIASESMLKNTKQFVLQL